MNNSSSANTVLQAIGRVYRIGQNHKSRVVLFTLARKSNQVEQARAADKMEAQISGRGKITVTDQELEEAQVDHPGEDAVGHQAPFSQPKRRSCTVG